MEAQKLYDLRENWEFCSGNDLHEFFVEQVGHPSPKGTTEISCAMAVQFVTTALNRSVELAPSAWPGEDVAAVKEMLAGWQAIDAIESVAVDDPSPVADAAVLYLNQDGTYTVSDNGEEVAGLDRENAIRVIVENLTA